MNPAVCQCRTLHHNSCGFKYVTR